MTEAFGNPSSRHRLGREAAEALAAHRRELAAALGASGDEIYFTSGGTEADNWAIAIMEQLCAQKGRHIITTSVEHAAVLEPIRALEQTGFSVSYLEPDRQGAITTAQLEAALRPDTAFVSMMLVNNESGACFPVREAARVLKERCPKALLHSDAVQGFLKLPFTAEELGVDLLSLSAHKIGGMKGSGALFIRRGLKARPLSRRRAGDGTSLRHGRYSADCRLCGGLPHGA